MRTCTRCHSEKPESDFPKHKRANGRIYFGSWCRPCLASVERERRKSNGALARLKFHCDEVVKECRECREIKAHSDFYPSKRGAAGVGAYCKSCSIHLRRTRHKASAEVARQKYRQTPKWKTGHRLREFARKSTIRTQSDGTATTEFMNKLYADSICEYCLETIPENDRTADHKNPLSRGGEHSAANLVMACHQCNSTKSSLTKDEFLEKIRDNYYRSNNPSVS